MNNEIKNKVENLYIYFDGVIIGIENNDINYIDNTNKLNDNIPIYYLSLSSESFKDKNEVLKDFKNYNIDQKKEPRFFYENEDGKCYVHEINEEFLKNKIKNNKSNKIYNFQELLFNYLYNERENIILEENKEYVFILNLFNNVNIIFFIENVNNNFFCNSTKIANDKECFNIINEQNRKNAKIDKETVCITNGEFENIKNIFISELGDIGIENSFKQYDLNIFKYQSNNKNKNLKNINWIDSDNIFKIEEIIKNLSKEKLNNLIKYSVVRASFLIFNYSIYSFLFINYIDNKTEELNMVKKEVSIIEEKYNKLSAEKFFDILEKNKNDRDWHNILYINSYLKKINLEPTRITYIPIEAKNRDQYLEIEVLGFINNDLKKTLKEHLAVEEMNQIVQIINGNNKPSYKLKINFDKIDFKNNFLKGIK